MIRAKQRRSLEEAIVDMVREPLVVLDDGLRVVVANRSFYRAFGVAPQETEGALFYELATGNGARPHCASFWLWSFRTTPQSKL
jgi:PAS domain-containing protein